MHKEKKAIDIHYSQKHGEHNLSISVKKSKKKMLKKAVKIAIFLLFTAALGGVYFFFFSQRWKDISYRRGIDSLEAGNFDEASKNLERSMTAQNEADVLHRMAVVEYNKKDFDKAVGLYEDSIAKNSENPLPYNGLGNLYRDRKDLDKAEENYRKAIALQETYIAAYSNLAIMFMDAGKKEAASEIVKKGLEKNFQSPELRNLEKILADK